jgi:hypothetical protein
MKSRGFVSKKRYLASFIIATVLFILIVILSYSFSYVELRRVSSLQGAIAYDIFDDKLDYTLFEKDVCFQESFEKISQDLNFQGRIIDDLEKKFGKNDGRVLFRKKFYTLVELEHFEFVRLLNERCDLGISTALFFYSNDKADLGRSEDVGRILDTLHSRNPDNLIIYSFDVNLESDLINKLKIKYGIEDFPSVVINEGIPVVNPDNIDDLEPKLDVFAERDGGIPVIYLN